MKENTYGIASTYGVLVLLEILLEHVRVTGLYDIHAQAVQCLDRLVNGTMLLVIVCITKPADVAINGMNIIISITSRTSDSSNT